MSKYKPKTFIMYYYGAIYKTTICCYPQSRWDLVYTQPDKVVLSNRNIAIEINEDDFKKHWKEVEG